MPRKLRVQSALSLGLGRESPYYGGTTIVRNSRGCGCPGALAARGGATTGTPSAVVPISTEQAVLLPDVVDASVDFAGLAPAGMGTNR